MAVTGEGFANREAACAVVDACGNQAAISNAAASASPPRTSGRARPGLPVFTACMVRFSDTVTSFSVVTDGVARAEPGGTPEGNGHD